MKTITERKQINKEKQTHIIKRKLIITIKERRNKTALIEEAIIAEVYRILEEHRLKN